MKKYLFFLGRNTSLAYRELESVFKTGIQKLSNEICVLETELHPHDYQDRLGSVIKIAEVIDDNILPTDIDDLCIKQLEESYSGSGKMVFALNTYHLKKMKFFLKQHLMNIKKQCNFPVRFCNKNNQNVSSVVSFKEIIKKGNIELNIVKNFSEEAYEYEESFMLARTISCQNIDFYSKRDYEKPYRNAKVGMLPPKLAQILLNLSPEAQTVWDPFCGLGTIPIEALLQQKKVFASDISEEMVEATTKNITWLLSQNEYLLASRDAPVADYDCFQHDASGDISQLQKVDAVITEGYLGPALRLAANEKTARDTDKELSVLWQRFFHHAASLKIKSIILCLPAYRTEKTLLYMNESLSLMRKSAYTQKRLSRSERGSIIYSRPDQFVCREILQFYL